MEPAGPRRRQDSEVYASAFLFALAAAVALGAYRLGLGTIHDPGPGFLSFATATLLAAMALGRLVRVAIAPPGPAGAQPARSGSRWGAVSTVLATLFGAGFMLERTGFSITIFLMLVALFGVVAGKRWWVSVLSAALVVTVARLLCRALGVPVPEGPLGL